MSKAKEFWIFKGSSNFCNELQWDDKFTSQTLKCKPEGFYDLVSTKDSIEGGIHVIEYETYDTLLAKSLKLREALKQIVRISEHYKTLEIPEAKIAQEALEEFDRETT